MAQPQLKPVATDDPPQTLDAAIAAFVSQPVFTSLDQHVRDVAAIEKGQIDNIAQQLDGRPLLVELGYDQGDLLIEALAAQAPDTPLLVIGDDLSQPVVRSLLKMKTSDIISTRASANEFSTSLRSLMDRMKTGDSDDNHSATCHLFTGAVGGAGATTLAIEMACQLASLEPKHGVCLIDLNLADGMVVPYLEGQAKLDTTVLNEAGERLDPALLDALSWPHPTGAKLIAAPRDYEAYSHVNADAILTMLDVACSTFSHVIVDMPRHRFEWSHPILEAADEVMIISEFTVPSLHAAADMARDVNLIRGTGTSEPKLVLNRMSDGGRSFSVSKASKAIGWPIETTIRSDWKAARSAVNLGMPVMKVQAKSPLVKDTEALVHSLLPDLAVADATPKKKGLFG